MSVTSVNTQIKRALADRRVTSAEVDGILKATEPSVSNGEAKALDDLHRMVTTAPSAPPGAVICFPTTIEREALTKLERFIGEQNLPIGDHRAAMREAINGALARVRLGPPKSELPKGIDKLMALDLAGAPTPPGSSTRRAYIDVAKKRYYLVETRASAQDNQRVWGPLALPKGGAPAPSLETILKSQARDLATKAGYPLTRSEVVSLKDVGAPDAAGEIEATFTVSDFLPDPNKRNGEIKVKVDAQGRFLSGSFTKGEAAGGAVTAARTEQLRREFMSLSQRGLVDYQSAGPPLGRRMVEVPLLQERRPDGFSYTALIPVGTLSPTGGILDPNKVDTFYVRRTGGIAGMTQYAGPLTIGA
ncbi:MAG: hypothetical protein A2138_25820 [Deltaproteobacteria bacterium RBG_16_71_12]|nr:MAG: hypothetical protein A2138_25820 [Deltaproteobacteria bacterium RBG_16_71_12]